MRRFSRRAARLAHEWIDPMIRGVSRARTLGLAAEMSFWLFLSLVPLAAVAGLVGARIATSRAPLEGGLMSSVPPDVRKMIDTEVQRVADWQGSTVAPIAIGTFLWLAASGVHAVFDALEVQTGSSRPWWKQRLLALVTCAALSGGVALLGLLAVGLGWAESLAGKAIPLAGAGASVVGGVVRAAVGVALGIAMVSGLYRVGIPRKARATIPILPGAVLAVLLIAGLGWGYRLYVSTAGTGDAYLGSLAVIGVTLMTLWLFSVALLLGAELNRVIDERRAAHPPTDAARAGPLPGMRPPWPISSTSSYRPISRTRPTAPSTGRSPSPSGSAPPSR
jgi:membrane protein